MLSLLLFILYITKPNLQCTHYLRIKIFFIVHLLNTSILSPVLSYVLVAVKLEIACPGMFFITKKNRESSSTT